MLDAVKIRSGARKARRFRKVGGGLMRTSVFRIAIGFFADFPEVGGMFASLFKLARL